MRIIAIIGPTASGKSDLALRAAEALDAEILSLDSLSIYKQIDIVSAKPSKEELARVCHFGIDVLYPNETFSVTTFIDLFHEAKSHCEALHKPLLIVGGTSFYLKTLIEGISETPGTNDTTRNKANKMLQNLPKAHEHLLSLDPETMRGIDPNDRYRIEKMLLLHLQTGQSPSEWFRNHPPKPVLTDYTLYGIDIDRETLRKRIALRTQKMLETGLIDEVAMLEQRYGRAPNAMKAIGIVEVLDYLDGKISEAELPERITTHTAQLAKRQQTFNRNQFKQKKTMSVEEIYVDITNKETL